MTEVSSETIHASCVAIGGRAVLIEGPSGSGKSDLALRLVDRGAALVSDDYTLLLRRDGRLLARAPDRLAGLIEIRGLGIRRLPHVADVPVALLVRHAATPPRMPEAPETRRIAGIDIAVTLLNLVEPSTPVKVAWVLDGPAA